MIVSYFATKIALPTGTVATVVQWNIGTSKCTLTDILKPQQKIKHETSGQSYKQFALVIYDSRVVIWGIFKSGTTLES